MSGNDPVRVLHIIDGLGGGGSERLIWEIVRLSDPRKIIHRVATVVPDDGTFVYAERLRRAGAYLPQEYESGETAKTGNTSLSTRIAGRVPPRLKPPLKALRSAARSVRNSVTEGLSSPSLTSEPGTMATGFSNDSSAYLSGKAEADRRAEVLAQEQTNEAIYGTAIRQVTEEYLRFRPDIINGHTFHGFSLSLSLKLMFHRPMVYFVPALFSQLEDVDVGWLKEQYERFHNGVDRFFTSYPGELLGLGTPREKVVRLQVAVDLHEVERVQEERERHRATIRRATGIADNDLVALSIGRLHPSKGHEYALEALPNLIKRFPQLHWIVIGSGSEQERRELMTKAGNLGVQDQTHVMGFEESPLRFCAAADIYFRTPVYEADNLSSCQAMASGVPMVGFDTGADSEVELIGRVGHGILVPPRDAAALAEAAGRILSLSDRGREMGQLGAEYCRAHLGFQHLIDTVTDVYSHLYRSRLESMMRIE